MWNAGIDYVSENGWFRPKPSGGGGGTTWDPAFILASAVSLSNGNLTISPVTPANNTARSVASHASGKYYYEIAFSGVANSFVGFCNSTAPNSGYLSSDNNSYGFFGGVWNGNSAAGTTTAPAQVAGHTYGIALDVTNHLVWAKDITAAGNWNANVSADPATGVNGCNFSGDGALSATALYAAATVGNAGDTLTANFGATAYAGTPPSGFGNW